MRDEITGCISSLIPPPSSLKKILGEQHRSALHFVFGLGDKRAQHVLSGHVPQLDPINLGNPCIPPAVDVIEFLAPAFDTKNLRKDCVETPAIILECFRLA